MGLYDTVRVKAKLPDVSPFGAETDFQTKEFNCLLETYEVREDGRLVKTSDGKGTWDPEPCEVVQANYHGDLYVYEIVPGTQTLYTLRLRFTEGVLASIKDVTQPKGGS